MQHRTFKRAAQWAAFVLVAAAIVPARSQAAPARTTVADIGRMIARSLVNVSSFQVVFDSSSTTPGSAGTASKAHFSEYFVRRGAGFSMYATFTAGGQTATMVDTGKHVCQRRGNNGTWNCNFPTSLATSFFANIDVEKAYKQSGTVLRDITSAGTKTIQGQSCAGYNFTATTNAIKFTAHGTYWFSTATGRVVEIAEVGSLVVAGSRASTSRSTVVYSRWNDPTIKIPAVPAS